MSDNALTTKPEARIAPWGSRDDLREIARRVQLMAPGGKKLAENEALALAQGAVAHGLDPFNGEIWYIPGSGLMAGIKGLRKAARHQIQGNFWAEFEQINNEDERHQLMIPEGALAFRCIIRDSETIRSYSEMWKELADKGVPLEAIPSIIGKRPYSEGVGYIRPDERTKMDPVQVAMKRAEADALKRRFDLPFAVTAENGDAAVDAEWTLHEPPEVESQTLPREAVAPPEPPTPLPPDEWANHLGPDDLAFAIKKGWLAQGAHFVHLINLYNLSPFKPGDDVDLLWFDEFRKARPIGTKGDAKEHAVVATEAWKKSRTQVPF
jgi:hypothetical protein